MFLHHGKRESYLGQPNDAESTVFCQYPTMALIFPGGGYRAMIGFAGFMQGAEERGILDCCTYIAGLSGSAWGVAGFINSLDVSDNTPRFHAEEFAEKLEKYVDNFLSLTMP